MKVFQQRLFFHAAEDDTGKYKLSFHRNLLRYAFTVMHYRN